MEDRSAVEQHASREEQIRELGFDPGQLTPQEQVELLELYQLYPDEALIG